MILPFRTAALLKKRAALILRDQFPVRIYPSRRNLKLPEKEM